MFATLNTIFKLPSADTLGLTSKMLYPNKLDTYGLDIANHSHRKISQVYFMSASEQLLLELPDVQ